MRILALGEVLRPSGYATVLEGLLPFLADDFDLHVFSRGYAGPTRPGRWTVHPNPDEADVWGIEEVPRLLERLRPDVVWIVYDAALYLVHREALAPYPTVLYCPIDGPNPEPETIGRLAPLARLVLFTEWARDTVRGVAAPKPPIDVIPHGVDTDTFRPLADRPAIRREMLGIDGGFVVLNANRNNRRKRPDVTIEGFARFARSRPDAYLCLHMDAVEDFDLRGMVAAAGIEPGRVIYSDRELEIAELNRLYNACDVGVNTSGGEGWGLVAFEHAATGTAQVVPRHSACAGLWRDAAVFLEPVETGRAPMGLCEHQHVDAEGFAAALARLYDDEAHRADRARRAFEIARDPRYRWERIAGQWRALFTAASR